MPKMWKHCNYKGRGVILGASGIWSLKSHEVVMFVCGKCGFMELYHKGKSMWKV